MTRKQLWIFLSLSAVYFFIAFAFIGCASEYAGMPDAQARAISDYRSAQNYCMKQAQRKVKLTESYIACMLDQGYIEPYPPEE